MSFTQRLKQAFLVLLRQGLWGRKEVEQTGFPLTPEEWTQIYDMSVKQTVQGIVYDGIGLLPKEQQPPRSLLVQWTIAIDQLERMNRQQNALLGVLPQLFGQEPAIPYQVLKGQGIAAFYRKPLHRLCGDIDLYFGNEEQTEKANQRIEALGAKVERGHYKHSHVVYKRMQIENHQFFLPVRGKKDVKELERHLRSVALPATEEVKYVEGTRLIMPSADFNALFLTAHAMNHFLYETIRLRNMCDWALFLKAEQQHVNWKVFYQWCDKMHYTRFVNSLNYICHHYLGVELCSELREDEYHAGLILNDMWEGDTLYNKKHSSRMQFRIELAMNFIRSSWKYSKIYQRNAFVSLTSQGISMLLDKHPKV